MRLRPIAGLLLGVLTLAACRPNPPLPTPAAAAVPAATVVPTPTLLAPPPAPTASAAAALDTPAPAATAETAAPPTPLVATAAVAMTVAPAASPSPTPCAVPGRIEQGEFTGAVAGQTRYRVYLPPCYGLDGRLYPALYMLPGNVYGDEVWDRLGLDEAAEAAIAGGLIPPFLIVMADGGWIANNSSGGPGSYEAVIVDELIPHIESRYCAWPERVGRAVGGMSRGGYWALEIAFRHPERFGSVGGHSAALIDSHAGPDLNPQYTALSSNLDGLRIYLDAGERDPYLPQLAQLHEDMTAAGIPHDWRLNEGLHEESYWITHLTDYLRWYADGWRAAGAPTVGCSIAN